jgi:hypothetical protein
MARTIEVSVIQDAVRVSPGMSTAALILAIVLTLLAADNSQSQAFDQQDQSQRRSGMTITSTRPEFTLTLPDRYTQLKSTGETICTFGTMDRTAGAIISLARLGHTIDPGPTDISKFAVPDPRRIPATWKTFPVDVIAWRTTAKNGTVSAARWVQIPLKPQAISIVVLVPVEKEAFADDLLHDFLTGLDGPSNWRVERPLTAGERARNLALGLALMLVLLAGPSLALQVWRRRLVRQAESNPATALRLQNLAAEMAAPPPRKPGYWIRVTAVVLALIAGCLAYLSLVAIGFSLIFNQAFGDSFKGILYFLESVCVLALFAILVIWMYGLRRRGRVLLDFGPDRMWKFNAAVGIICLFAGIMGAAEAWTKLSALNWTAACQPAMQLALAGHFFFRAFGRVQITDRGIWQNLNLVRWEQIDSCRWVGDSTLVASKHESPISIKLSVPPDRKQTLQDLLTERSLAYVQT